jgi:6-phosphofructokinase
MAKNVIIGQSGGPTAVINSSLAGVYKAACSLGADKVYGMKYGIEGLLKEELIELNVLLDDRMSIELLKRTPSSYLGSCRYKLPDPDTDSSPFVKLFTLFDKYDICAVFYIGGNDSMDTIQAQPLRRPGGQQRAVHRCAQDHRQRPVPDRPHPRLRLGGQVHRHHSKGSHPRFFRI